MAGTELRADLLLRLAKRERLGLCEKVGQEDAVVLRFGDRVVRRCGGEEVCGDEFGALVNQLVERVLPVRARRTPDDGLEMDKRVTGGY